MIVQTGRNLLDGYGMGLRRCQLDGEWKAIQLKTDLCDRHGITRCKRKAFLTLLRSLYKELDARIVR
jgi:hypothetical protein